MGNLTNDIIRKELKEEIWILNQEVKLIKNCLLLLAKRLGITLEDLEV